jgi:hypothetical protein
MSRIEGTTGRGKERKKQGKRKLKYSRAWEVETCGKRP